MTGWLNVEDTLGRDAPYILTLNPRIEPPFALNWWVLTDPFFVLQKIDKKAVSDSIIGFFFRSHHTDIFTAYAAV